MNYVMPGWSLDVFTTLTDGAGRRVGSQRQCVAFPVWVGARRARRRPGISMLAAGEGMRVRTTPGVRVDAVTCPQLPRVLRPHPEPLPPLCQQPRSRLGGAA